MKQENVRFWNLIEGQLVKLTLTGERATLNHVRVRFDNSAMIVTTTHTSIQGDHIVQSCDRRVTDCGESRITLAYTRICHIGRLHCGAWVRKDRQVIGGAVGRDQFEVDPFADHFIHLPAWKDGNDVL